MPELTIKIECECGTRFKFDVEPVEGQMPVEVYCPHCGLDGTDEANRQIQALLAGEPPPPAKIDVPKPFKVETAKSALKLAGKRPPLHTVTLPPQVKKPGIGHPCTKHPKETTVNSCLLCKRPICPVCMSKYGYFCSTTCSHQAEQRGMEIPVFKGQESWIREQKFMRTKQIVIGTTTLVILLCAFWAWYSFLGSKPGVKSSVQIEKADNVVYCRFAGADQVLLKTDRVLSLYDAKALKPLWSTSMAPYEKPRKTVDEMPTAGEREQKLRDANAQYGEDEKIYNKTGKWPKHKGDDDDDDDDKYTPPTPEEIFLDRFTSYAPFGLGIRGEDTVQVRGEEIWVLFDGKLVVFDRKTGAEKKKVPIRGRILQLTPGDSVIFVTYTGKADEGQLTRVAFRTGDVFVDKVKLPPQRKWKLKDDGTVQLLGEELATQVEEGLIRGTPEEAAQIIQHDRTLFIPAGVNVARLEVDVIEEKLVSRQVVNPEDIKPEKEPGKDGPMKVTDAIEFAKQLRYEAIKARGGIHEEEDQSRYKVSLRRHMEDGAPAWTGEVIGPPAFVPLKSVDALVSSRSIVVFDKENEKLWESPLAFPAGGVRLDFGEANPRGPCLEAGNTLYLYDSQALTSFELMSGKVRWRMPLPGVQSLRLDPDGLIYVTSQESVSKVDPETGKVAWKVDKGDVTFFLSGKYLYLSKAQTSGADMIQNMWTGKEIPTHFHIYRVDPGTGTILWDFYRPKEPAAMDFSENRILLMFPTEYRRDPKNPMGKPLITVGEMQVLKYVTF
jgi:putative pyrroloquinoline-quinone binding quinoprotein